MNVCGFYSGYASDILHMYVQLQIDGVGIGQINTERHQNNASIQTPYSIPINPSIGFHYQSVDQYGVTGITFAILYNKNLFWC